MWILQVYILIFRDLDGDDDDDDDYDDCGGGGGCHRRSRRLGPGGDVEHLAVLERSCCTNGNDVEAGEWPSG